MWKRIVLVIVSLHISAHSLVFIQDLETLKMDRLQGTVTFGYKWPGGRMKELPQVPLSLDYPIYNFNLGLFYRIHSIYEVGIVFDVHTGNGKNDQYIEGMYLLSTAGESNGIGAGFAINITCFQRPKIVVTFENQCKLLNFTEELVGTTQFDNQTITLFDYIYSINGLNLTTQINFCFPLTKRQNLSLTPFYDYSFFSVNNDQHRSHFDLNASFQTPYFHADGVMKNLHSGWGVGLKYSIWIIKKKKRDRRDPNKRVTTTKLNPISDNSKISPEVNGEIKSFIRVKKD